MIKNINQQNKHCTIPPSQQTYIKRFYRKKMHYNYKSDEKILKTLIHRNILPTDPNKKIKLIICYNKFKTSNLVIRNNSSPSIGVLQKTNIIYKFKCPLGDCISDNNNYIYVGLTSTTLSRRLAMHLSDTSSIAQHLKKHSCPTTELWKILRTTLLWFRPVYTYTHIFIYIYIYIYSNIRIYIYIYIYFHTHTYIYIYIYIHTHTHTHIYIYTNIYICTHIFIYINMQRYILNVYIYP